MANKIVLITTGQPSLNPRIVKEADAFCNAGYQVTLFYCHWIKWADETDKKLLQHVGWEYYCIGGSPTHNKTMFFLTRLRFKINRYLNKGGTNKFLIAERSQARCYDELLLAAKKIKANWYIGHNLGALPIAVKAAAHNKAKCGFDFEDYHREENEGMHSYEKKRIAWLEENYLPLTNYLSFSSPLIKKVVLGNFPGYKEPTVTLMNCFPLAQQPTFQQRANDKVLNLFWFSQTIGKNRGLEILVDTLKQLNDDSIHLTLAGNYSNEIRDFFYDLMGLQSANLHFAGIIQPGYLPAFAAQFDVGMAIELDKPLNRDICLTNKIFTYLLAGNAIILSETSMQKVFNEKYKVGESYPVNDAAVLAEKIELFKNKEKLAEQRKHNFEMAAYELNGEKESKKLLNLITNSGD